MGLATEQRLLHNTDDYSSRFQAPGHLSRRVAEHLIFQGEKKQM